MAIPYLEIGSHEWDRGVNDGETYKHSYYGVGAMIQFSPVDKLVMTLDGMIGRTHSASIDVSSAPNFAGLPIYEGSLGNFQLSRFGATADYAFTKHIHGMIGADYTSYKYGMSPPHYGIWEPDSKTEMTMYRVGIGYVF